MEDFEQRALSSAPHAPLWWFRYVDDTHTKLKRAYADEFTAHINGIDPNIKFTFEPQENNSLAFLDTLTVINPDKSLKITIYRKATHTDQYLNFDSNHPLEHKLSVIRTLYHRAKNIVTEDADRAEEKKHVDKALGNCGYPQTALRRVEQSTPRSPSSQQTTSASRRQPVVTIPYIKGVSESLRRIFQDFGVRACFKPGNKLSQLLVHPKDKQKKGDATGPVYLIQCKGLLNSGQTCSETYIGETERSLKQRFLEHNRRSSVSSSEVSQHIHVESPGHSIDLDQVKILDREPGYKERGIKEAIFIRARQPSLNRDQGRYQLPPIWDRLLQSSAI